MEKIILVFELALIAVISIIFIRKKEKTFFQFAKFAFILTLVLLAILYNFWEMAEYASLVQKSEIASLKNGKMEYQIIGNSNGPAVVISHGSPGGYDQGLQFCKYLDLEKYRCVAVSRPGYLRSEVSLGKFFDQQADSIAELLAMLKINKAAIIGVSGGGPTALQFALRHSEMCSHLIMLAAISEKWEEQGSWLDKAMENNLVFNLLAIASEIDPDLLISLFVQNEEEKKKFTPEKKEFLVQSFQSLALLNKRQPGFDNDYEQFLLISKWPLWQIRIKTLAIYGDKDENVPVHHGENILDLVPQARLIKLENAEHTLLITHFEKIKSEVSYFLAQ